jgi:hypothetical protein
MSFGQGMALSYSLKHKINKNSSTETELVGVDNLLRYILWACYFMIEQGYNMDPSLLYQDNMSAILLETNGRASSSKRTKHIKVRYYLIKDKVDRGEITIEHYPTEQMWTDINTKPKQGAVFRAFKGHVMGIPADYNDASFATRCNFRPLNWVPKPVSMLPIPRDRVAAQECVGDNTKGPKPTTARSAAKVRIAVDVEAHAVPTTEPTKQDQRAPIKMVSGRAWSPGIYQALRLLGKSLDVACMGEGV